MFKISLDKECGCFKKSDFQNNKSYDNSDEALIKAQSMVNIMNNDFCGKHNFTISENGTTFSISMNSNSGCCGGGHCS